ncbi:MAG: hypothetical protein P4L28_01590 [Paludibacteraceae bacterium]|nr:hypothetical protein [Paludibacteraceae bacterium]
MEKQEYRYNGWIYRLDKSGSFKVVPPYEIEEPHLFINIIQ